MRFEAPLVPARLIRRYKRFLADCVLEDGTEVTAHCANPGAMTGLAEPGTRAWLLPVSDPERKLQWSWKLAELPAGALACIDTGLANRIVAEALADGRVPGLAAYQTVRREVAYGQGSRVDFLLGGDDLPPAYVEVKSVTLMREAGLAEFPDTVTARGARHLAELAEMAAGGARAVLFYLVQRSDAEAVSVAADIDPAYAQAFTAARQAGVEVMCHAAAISTDGISIGRALPFRDERGARSGGIC